jgi:SPP1 gp7 family putative phage head morphogenesis protein
MPTANETYFDAAIRRAVQVRRFQAGEVKRMISLLEEADRELVRKLRRRLPGVGSFRTNRFQELLKSVREDRDLLMRKFRGKLNADLPGLARTEADAEIAMMDAAIPVEVGFASVDMHQLRAAISSKPFNGKLLREWHQSLKMADRRNLEQAIRLGVVQGESVPTMVQRVAGTRAANFRDGVLSITRRNAEAVVRTAVNHTSNQARQLVHEANSDIVTAERWVSTLDGRTSPICRSRDGKVAPVGNNPLPPDAIPLHPSSARPPAHVGCRSVMVAIFGTEFVAPERPFVRDTRTGRRRQLDFRKEARRTGRSVQAVRKEWTDANIGRVPAKTTYQQWLNRQPAGFQDEVLGKTKGALFRRGDLKIDQFVDRAGNELSLSQLAKSQPTAFMDAGFDPADFTS